MDELFDATRRIPTRNKNRTTMKQTLTIIIILFNTLCYGQEVMVNGFHNGIVGGHIVSEGLIQDSLTAERFIEDSIGNSYEIQYRYNGVDFFNEKYTDFDKQKLSPHTHYIALVNIIKYHGNKQQTIFSNIKAIYSPTIPL